MGSSPTKMIPVCTNELMQQPVSVYVPLESLTEPVVRSIISVTTSSYELNMNYSQRTLLMFLLAIDEKLQQIENKTDTAEQTSDESIIQHTKNVRQWLVYNNKEPLNWDELRKIYNKMTKQEYNSLANYFGVKDAVPYFELTMRTPFNDVKRSRDYINKFRKDGFKPEELKLYWNVEQLENLCPKQGDQSEITPPHDPSDTDTIENLRKFPVYDRNHRVKINYINKGIEKAVFDVPKDAQIIVLNFANEQSPGGGYLRHARAQEEIILYNSDGYRALLDLKYQRMNGGYAILEFGLAYVRNIRFFDAESEERHRLADMLVSACYCLNGSELYDNPRTPDELKKNNLAKFRAFMATAVANTIGDGSNTYLLLGPIGTGAFGNDVEDIAECFREVLEMPMMNSTRPIRYAFSNIWFVSIDDWKNDIFQKILPKSESDNAEEL
ncbi:unnamed protein product [Rotaria sordida]|uniref:Microbial-type PARG catalytic domain-containing protein n=4 Tax=Rotaria sordida TaxID=392033 RepID=A0A814U3U8_9BILA|nr:unnamed protein product [Rotaria sordida]